MGKMKGIVKQIHAALLKQGKTVAVAESCTGGLLSNLLTGIPGSSAYFIFGAVTYANSAKHKILGIPFSTINRYGAVSKQIATAMAKNVKKIAGSNYGIGITGIAGPTGGSIKKPVGTVFIAIAAKASTLCRKYHFHGSRAFVRQQTAKETLKLLNYLVGEGLNL
jgi:nicotinamide-nucleotide amidase